jgi:hypothetical protein
MRSERLLPKFLEKLLVQLRKLKVSKKSKVSHQPEKNVEIPANQNIDEKVPVYETC